MLKMLRAGRFHPLPCTPKGKSLLAGPAVLQLLASGRRGGCSAAEGCCWTPCRGHPMPALAVLGEPGGEVMCTGRGAQGGQGSGHEVSDYAVFFILGASSPRRQRGPEHPLQLQLSTSPEVWQIYLSSTHNATRQGLCGPFL